MRILVTGGAGFIGSHSAEALLAAGHRVRVLDNLSSGDRAQVPAGAELLVADVTDAAALRRAMAGCDAALHLAALVSVSQSMAEPRRTYTVNTGGTANLLEAARLAGVGRVLIASTSAVYGDLPGRKTAGSPLRPLSPYGASKLMAEELGQIYARCYGLEVACPRYFNVFGPRQRAGSPYSGVVARWCAALRAGQACTVYGDGGQTRDFIAVRDVARANALLLTAPLPRQFSAYNVASGASLSLNELFGLICAAAGRAVPLRHEPARPGDIRDSLADTAELAALGWRPATSMAAGLAELLAAPAAARP